MSGREVRERAIIRAVARHRRRTGIADTSRGGKEIRILNRFKSMFAEQRKIRNFREGEGFIIRKQHELIGPVACGFWIWLN